MMWHFWRQRLAEFFDRARSRRRRAAPNRQRALFERLESRQMLSANSLSILPASTLEGNLGASLLNFVATRSGDLNSVVTVAFQTSNGSAVAPADYTAVSGEATFNVGQSSTSVAVSINGDTTPENNETFQVTLTGVINTTGAAAALGASSAFALGTNPQAVVLADLNGDGRPEAIAVNGGSSNFSILRNTTIGGATTASFATQQDQSTQANPQAVAVGDLNGDGRPDVVVANGNADNVSVFLNTTTAGATTFTFASPVEFSTANQPHAVTLVDFNQDGKLDIAAAAIGADSVSVLLNSAAAGATTPSFAAAQALATAASPTALASGDLNGDGKRDLVVVNSVAGNVSVYLNNTTTNSGTLQWQPRQDFAVGTAPAAVALGDLNGDGLLDLAVANEASDNVSLLLNQTPVGSTTANLSTAQQVSTGNAPRSLALADFNGDGTLDLLLAHRDDQTTSVLINRTVRGAGSLSLATPVNRTVGAQPNALAVGDLNGDGKPDLVSADLAADSLSAVLNETIWDGSLPGLATSALTAATTAHGLASGDLNGDGKPELVAAVPGSNLLGVYVNTTNTSSAIPSFAARQDVALGAAPVTVRLVDVNLDGRLDAVVPADVNRVLVLINTTPAGSSTISFDSNPLSYTSAGSNFEVTAGDLNADGRVDLVVSTPEVNSLTVLTNTTTPGAATASFTATSVGALNAPHGVTLADLNGDGKLDLITVNQGTGSANGSGSVASVRLNTTSSFGATPTFGARVDLPVGTAPRSVVAFDVNGDGKLDLVTANRVGNNVSVLLNNLTSGVTSFASTAFALTQFSAGTEPYAVRMADINGDGRGDLIVGNLGSSGATVLLNTTTPGSSTPAFSSSTIAGSAAARYIAVADLNLDGRPDFAATNNSGAGLSLYVNQPASFDTSTATGTITNDDVPQVVSIVRSVPSASATNETSVTFAVTFSHSVSGVDSSDFLPSGDATAIVQETTGSGVNWTVRLDALSEGTLSLDLIDDDSIVDGSNLPLGGSGANNGNFSATQAYTIDWTPPTLTPILTPAPNANGWNSTDVQVTFDPVDNLSGINFATLQGNTTLTQEGVHSAIQGQVFDNAGNSTIASSGVIRIDKTAPSLQYTTNIQPNAAGWFRTNVTLNFTADDPGGSGVPNAPSPVTVTGEGNNLTATGTATDAAGNVGTLAVNNIRIDRTAATVTRVTSTTPDGTYGPGSEINLTIEFSEAVTLVGAAMSLELSNGVVVTLSPGSVVNSTQASATYLVADGQPSADLDVVAIRLASGAELLDVADNPIATPTGIVSIPAGQSLANHKNLVISSAQVVQFLASSQVVDEFDGTVNVAIVFYGASATPITLPITVTGTATNGSDFSMNLSPAVIPAGSSSVNLVIQIIDDTLAELPETITITLGTPTGAPLGSITQHTVVLLDNELPQLAISDAGLVEGNSGTREMQFVVTRQGDLLPAVSFGYATQDQSAIASSDYNAITGTATIPSGASSTSFSVTVLGDTFFENNETVQVVITGISAVLGPTPTFGATSSHGVGNAPVAATTADLNLDGIPDIVTADFLSGGFSVARGTTQPGATSSSFDAPAQFSIGASPGSVATGDLNGDGRPDVILTSRTSGNISVRLNTTTPGATSFSFAPVQSFTAGSLPAAVAVGDFNRDGRLDLAVANSNSNNISLLRNTATAGAASISFAAAETFAVQVAPTSIAAADLNGDGNVDWAVTNQGSDTVSVLFNTTAANATTFGVTVATHLPVGSAPQSVVIGDLNNDGRPDVVVANRDSNTFSWLRNATTPGSTTPTFGLHQATLVGLPVSAVALQDLNLDGRLDVAVTSDNADSLFVYVNQTATGNPSISFQALTPLAVNNNPVSVVSADFDRDGDFDLATFSVGFNNFIGVLNTTTLNPRQPEVDTTNRTATTPVATLSVDLNGDGLPEIVSANDLTGTVSVFHNSSTLGGASSFAAGATFNVGANPRSIAAADINGDGRPDLAVTNYNSSSVSILLNTTAPGATNFSFAPAQSLSVAATPTDLAWADFNGDGRADLAVSQRSSNSVNVYLNQATPGSSTINFGSAANFATDPGPTSMTAADLNGDGLVDLAITAYTGGTVSLLRNTTAPGSNTASFATAAGLLSQVGVQGITSGDFNRDGRVDLAAVVRSANVVSVYLNSTAVGSSTLGFASTQNLSTGALPLAVVAGDLDRDGIIDLAVANAGSGSVTRWLNRTVAHDTTIAFAAGAPLSTGGSPRDIALADLNLDGIVDLLVANRSGNAVATLLGRLATLVDGVANGEIANDDLPPTIEFASATQSVNENSTSVTVTVRLSAVAGVTVSVPFSIVGGSASGGGVDYSASSNSPLTLNPGSSTAAVTLTIQNDLLDELNETIVLQLGAPTNATLGATTQSTVTILDDDENQVQFAAASATVNENVGSVTVLLQLASPAISTISLPFSFSGGTASNGVDFTLPVSPLTINAGASTAAIILSIANDLLDENDETLTLALGAPTGAVLAATTQSSLTIVDDDAPPTVQFSVANQTPSEAAGTVTVTATLSAPSAKTVSVPFTVSGSATLPDDYTISGNSFIFTPGQTSTFQLLALIDDLLPESNETIALALGSPTNATLGAITQQTTTIVDNDQLSVEFANGTQSVAENALTTTVVVRLSAVAGSTVTIPLTIAGGSATSGSDYNLSSTQLTINAGASTAAVTVSLLNDSRDEVDETLVIDLGPPTGASLATVTRSTLTIVDDDAPPTVQFALATQSVGEAAGSVVLVATLDAPSGKTISVGLNASGSATTPSDFTLGGASFVFAPGQTSASQTVAIVDDTNSEGTEEIVLTLSAPTNATLGTPTQQTLSIVDNEGVPSVSLSLGSATLAESGGSTPIIATLSATSATNVTVQLDFAGTATLGSDYSAATSTLVIPAGSLSGSVSLNAINDVLLEGDETILVEIGTLSGAVENGTQQVTASLTDDASDPFQLVGQSLTINGTTGNDSFRLQFGSSTNSFTATVNGVSGSFTATSISLDGLDGNDSFDATLSALADQVSLTGTAGTISSSAYSISHLNCESVVVRGNTLDRVELTDTGIAQKTYLLPTHAIMDGTASGVRNQATGFGHYTANATGNNDSLYIYGDSGNQNFTANADQSIMPVGSIQLIGNLFTRVYAYAMGGNDTVTYNGSSANEQMTALSNYTLVIAGSLLKYFSLFDQVTVSGNGGTDVAVMYDSAGNDTFTAREGNFEFAGATFRNLALGYDQAYAYRYFGGQDTATLNGGSGNDRLSARPEYTVLQTPTSLFRATSFNTVIVNAGTGTDTATLLDSTGNDTLVASGNSAEITYANGRKVRLLGFDSVTASGANGGVNRRTVGSLTYVLRFTGTWV